jgi:hypothetical protein
MDEPAAKRVFVAEQRDTNDEVKLGLYDLPFDVWSIMAEQGGLEVADLISLQRSCKSLNRKLSDNTASASLVWHSAVQRSPYASHPRTVPFLVLIECLLCFLSSFAEPFRASNGPRKLCMAKLVELVMISLGLSFSSVDSGALSALSE